MDTMSTGDDFEDQGGSTTNMNNRSLEDLDDLLQRLLFSKRRPALTVISRKLAALEKMIGLIEDRRLAGRWMGRLAELLERYDEVQQQQQTNDKEFYQEETEVDRGRGFSSQGRGRAGRVSVLFTSPPLDSSSPHRMNSTSKGGLYRFSKDGREGSNNRWPSLSLSQLSTAATAFSPPLSQNTIFNNHSNLETFSITANPPPTSPLSDLPLLHGGSDDRVQRSHLITLYTVVEDLLTVWPLPVELLERRLQEMEARIALLEDHLGPVATSWRREVAKLWVDFAMAFSGTATTTNITSSTMSRRPLSVLSNRGDMNQIPFHSRGHSNQKGRISNNGGSSSAVLLQQQQQKEMDRKDLQNNNSSYLQTSSSSATESDRLEIQAFLLAKLKAAPTIDEADERISLHPKCHSALTTLLGQLSSVMTILQRAGLLEDRLLAVPLYETVLCKLPATRREHFTDDCYPAVEQQTLGNLWRYLNNWATIRAHFELSRTVGMTEKKEALEGKGEVNKAKTSEESLEDDNSLSFSSKDDDDGKLNHLYNSPKSGQALEDESSPPESCLEEVAAIFERNFEEEEEDCTTLN